MTFWLPPEVLHRKRAHSLVPTAQNDSKEDCIAGTMAPILTNGFKELDSSNPKASRLIFSDGLPLFHPQTNRQRRASMQEAIDIRQIDSKLYQSRLEERQMSVGSVMEEPLGSINFSIYLNAETNLLSVFLIAAQNISPRECNLTADIYCQVCILPNHHQNFQSKIHRKTTDPQFNEEFAFDVQKDLLGQMALLVLVYACDEFARHECIGQVKLQLDTIDLSQRHMIFMPLAPREIVPIMGYIMFSIGYLPSAERLTVVVVKARNLQNTEDGKIPIDPYVKVVVSCGVGTKAKKKKTSTKHNVFSPVWNEALVFNLPKDNLPSVSLEFLLCHDNKIGTDEILGRTNISHDAVGDEKIHWDEMVQRKSSVARWHHLTP